jgi:CheY-like chemotaxis protein
MEEQVSMSERKTTVFLVDDDADIRRFLKRLLSAQPSYEVWSFSTGTEAIAALKTHRPDIVLSDLDMPGAPGEEVARVAAQLPCPPAIALMSGDPRRLERARPLARFTMVKPFSIDDLLKSLASAGSDQARAASPTGQDTPVPPRPQ